MKQFMEGDLYLETCNYIIAIVSDQRTKPIVQSILTDRDCLFSNYNKLAEEVTAKLHAIAQNIRELSRISTNAKEITALFNSFDSFANGKSVVCGVQTWISLESTLRTICWAIRDSKTMKDNGIFTIKDNLVRFDSDAEELFAKCHDNWELIQTAKQTAVWGAWGRLAKIYRAVYGTRRECHEALNQNVYTGSDFVSDVNEMKKIIANSSALKNLSLIFPGANKNDRFNPELALIDLERVHNSILDRLNRTSLGLALLTKYKQRCEWYDLESISRCTTGLDEEKRENDEKELTRKICIFLHENNVMPLSEVVLGKNRPDVLIESKEEWFPIEVKVVKRNDNKRVKKGFNQIVTYIRTICAPEGFYVIFCKGNFTLQIPQTVLTDSYRINIVTINLPESAPSKNLPEIWNITENKLLF